MEIENLKPDILGKLDESGLFKKRLFDSNKNTFVLEYNKTASVLILEGNAEGNYDATIPNKYFDEIKSYLS